MSTWNLEGKLIKARYMDIVDVEGVVLESRVKYGGKVQHTVSLDFPIKLFGTERDRLLIDGENVLEILEEEIF